MKKFVELALLALAAVALYGEAAPGAGGQHGDRAMDRALDRTMDKTMDRDRAMDRDRDRLHRDRPIYGAEVMTPREQERYRQRLVNMTSEQDRARFIARHRARMDARAKARGVTLRDVGTTGDQDRDRLRDQDADRNRERQHQTDG